MSRTRFSWIRSLAASLLVHASLAVAGVLLLKPPAIPGDRNVQVELFSASSSMVTQKTKPIPPAIPRPRLDVRPGVQQARRLGSSADSLASRSEKVPDGTRFDQGKPRFNPESLAGEASADLSKTAFNHRVRNSVERQRTSKLRRSLDNRRRMAAPEPTPFFRVSAARNRKITRKSRDQFSARLGGRPLDQGLENTTSATEIAQRPGQKHPGSADEPNAPRRASARARPGVNRAATSTATVKRALRTEESATSDSASSRRQPDLADMAAPQSNAQSKDRDLGRGWGTRAAWLGEAGATGNKPLWLNTADSRYVTYFSAIYKKVQPLWHFPEELEARLEQGEVLVQFTILESGHIRALKIKRSSGYPSFDQIALAAVRKASPFQTIPTNLGTELNVICPFEFNNPLIR